MKTLRNLSLLALLPILISCGGGGDSGCATGLGVLGGALCGGSSPNTAPVASAGSAQTVTVTATVTLDGTASTDANGDTLTYKWVLSTKPTGSASVLLLSTTSKPTFVPDKVGVYVATLVVNDGKADSAASTVPVTATATGLTGVSGS